MSDKLNIQRAGDMDAVGTSQGTHSEPDLRTRRYEEFVSGLALEDKDPIGTLLCSQQAGKPRL